jgi:hypothetical protein
MKLIDVTKKKFNKIRRVIMTKNMFLEINHEKISEKTDN